MSKVKLKTISEVYDIGLNYLKARKTGRTKSVQTPWPVVNQAGVNGFEWGTIITLAGRPGSGKTAFVNAFTRAAHKLNVDQDFHVIDFQFEMPDRQTAVREFTGVTGLNYSQLLSAHRPVGDDIIKDLEDYVYKNQSRDIYIVDDPLTIAEMREFILAHHEKYKKNMIITIDHSLLVKLDKGDKNKFDMLYELGEMMTEIKKKIPVIWFVLTQMNRSMEDASRKNPGTIANYPTGADIFGADALMQHSDMVIILNHPVKNQVTVYGPAGYQMGPDTIVAHFVKVRNGDPMIGFFDFIGAQAKFVQIPTPPSSRGQSSTQSGGTGNGISTKTVTAFQRK
jgi:replicative DNA helicase